jgi:hypothetical protein
MPNNQKRVTMKTTNDWDFFREQAQNLSANPRPEAWDKLQQQLVQQRGKVIRKLWMTRTAAAASVLLIGFWALQQGQPNGLHHPVEDITTEQLLAESYLEKVNWSAVHLREAADIQEGTGNKRLVPKKR